MNSPSNIQINSIIENIPELYLQLFESYNERFVSFVTLFQHLSQKHELSIDQFHQALLELERRKYFLLGGYSKYEDIKDPQYALHIPDRGYLYWVFRPEPPDPLKSSPYPVVDLS